MKDELYHTLLEIVSQYCDINRLNMDINLMSRPNNLYSRDMAAIFLDIKRILNVEPKQIVSQMDDYTFNNLLRVLRNEKENESIV